MAVSDTYVFPSFLTPVLTQLFLPKPPTTANLRKEHLTNYYCRWPTVEKFKNLMSSKSRNTLINLSKYIYFAFELRSEPEDI